MTTHHSFHGLGLSSETLQALTQAKYTAPTPIQVLAIPPALAGRDVIGCAQTGTGKTAAFVVPLIERLAGQMGPSALILAPTRELATQIQHTVNLLGRGRRVVAALIVGGADMAQQARALRQGPELLVATPGRLLDHLWNGTINLDRMKAVVFDEADRLLDMGFAPQINQIIEALPERRQTMLFSATMTDDVAALARTCLDNPVKLQVAPPGTVAARAQQQLFHASVEQKPSLLKRLLKAEKGRALVFTRTKSRANRLGKLLLGDGMRAAVLHGDRTMGQRRQALEGFKGGKYDVLVATDIMARGIHVDGIAHVINYDLPHTPEDYVHRIGRTARAQAPGLASSFVTPEETRQLRAIERLVGHSLPVGAH